MLKLPHIDNVTLVISHGACTDGMAAAYVAKRKFPEAEVKFYSYGYDLTLPEVIGHDVLICDFSFPREDISFMEVYANKLWVLDHHKTAEEDLRGLPFCYFDMQRSGAGLVWDALFRGEPRPALINYVEDHDLWRHRLPDSEAMSALIQSYALKSEAWDNLWERFEAPDHSWLVEEGYAIGRANKQHVERIVANARKISLCGYEVWAANAPVMQPEVGNVLAQKSPFGAVWFVATNGDIRVSLRSTENGIDVAEIAKEFGGGGHVHAAAFTISSDEGVKTFLKRT